MRGATRNRLAGVGTLGGITLTVSGGGSVVAKPRHLMSEQARAPRVYGPPPEASVARGEAITAALERGIALELERAEGKRRSPTVGKGPEAANE